MLRWGWEDEPMCLTPPPSRGGGIGIWVQVWIPNPEALLLFTISSPCQIGDHLTSGFLYWPLTWLFEGGAETS
jgi:hypothetical protein